MFATHWVENIVTGVQVEAKVVIDVFGGAVKNASSLLIGLPAGGSRKSALGEASGAMARGAEC
jgi:hypothetical protein